MSSVSLTVLTILHIIELASRMIVNLCKCSMAGTNLHDDELRRLAHFVVVR